MNINKALEQTGKAFLPSVSGRGEYIKDLEGEFVWINKVGGIVSFVRYEDGISTDWLPYLGEIRPKRSGELWLNNLEGQHAHTEYCNDDLMWIQARCNQINVRDINIAHNQNGWKLIYSPDPETRERIKEKV
jgi:hypothetical protein